MQKTIYTVLRFGLLILIVLIYWNDSAEAQTDQQITVQAGDRWRTLATRFDTTADVLREANANVVSPLNPLREPLIGVSLSVPRDEVVFGRIHHPNTTPTLFALAQNEHPNRFTKPYLIPFQPIVIHDDTTPLRDLPPTLGAFELSHTPAFAGEAIGFRGIVATGGVLTVTLASAENDRLLFDTFYNEKHVVGLRGTGAFYKAGSAELTVQADNAPLWSQPYLIADQAWDYQNITLTGTAAQIDSASIQAESTRLFDLWTVANSTPLWSTEFALPISDFLNYSAAYGVRRSYNSGGYNSYHEGVDFSAYGGTPVFATNSGTVIVAETLYVRGGAVIIDHGLGIYSGVYHLSEILVSVGETVTQGQPIGAVGTTGLSTGNHLHWDFLVSDTWVDASKWVERRMGCWVLEGLSLRCE